MEDPVVVIGLPEGGRGRMVLGPAVGSGATVVDVAMEGETGSSNAGCIDDGVYADVFLVIEIQRHLRGGPIEAIEEKS